MKRVIKILRKLWRMKAGRRLLYEELEFDTSGNRMQNEFSKDTKNNTEIHFAAGHAEHWS